MSAVDRLIEAIEPLAEKIGEAGSHVYEVAVREAVVQGALNAVWAVALGVLSVVLLRAARSTWACANELEERRGVVAAESWRLGSVALHGLTILAALTSWGLVSTAVRYLVNPEYQAIQMLLEAVRG